MGTNDYELLYMIQQGSDEALQMLMEKYIRIYRNIVHKYPYRYRETSQLDDLYSKCRMLLHEAALSYRDDMGVPFHNYYKLLCEQLVINEIRFESTGQRRSIYEAISLDSYINEQETMYLCEVLKNKEPEFDPQWMLHYKQLSEEQEEYKEILSPLERQIWDLKVYGYSYQAIAEYLDLSVKKVDNTLQRIKKKSEGLIDYTRAL